MRRESDIAPERQAEYEALVALLLADERAEDTEAPDLAAAIARAALEPGHLWRAMQLGDREELRAIFRDHFPALYRANDKDMRWKKFLYKRLCGWEGFHS